MYFIDDFQIQSIKLRLVLNCFFLFYLHYWMRECFISLKDRAHNALIDIQLKITKHDICVSTLMLRLNKTKAKWGTAKPLFKTTPKLRPLHY